MKRPTRQNTREQTPLRRKFSHSFLLNSRVQKSVLEVGCGTGHFTRWFESCLALEAFGVDMSKAMLKEARIRWRSGDLLLTEGSHLPLKNKSVDVSAFITSLEFIPDAPRAIKEAARVSRLGIALGLMNKNSLGTLKKRLRAASGRRSFYGQAKFYSRSDVEKLLESTLQKGYDVEFVKTTLLPKVFGGGNSRFFPFGEFLGIAVKLEDNYG